MNRVQTLVTVIICAFIGSDAASSNALKTGEEKSLLWQISGNGLEQPSYLFGTLHVICQDDYLWTDSMEACFRKAKALCLEMNMNDPGIQEKITASLKDKSGKKFSSYFTSGDYQKASVFFRDSLRRDIAAFDGYKPIVLMSVFFDRGVGCDNQISYEDKLSLLANTNKMQMLGVETVEEQLSLMYILPADSIISQLMRMVNGENTDAIYKELSHAYGTQDIHKLYKMIRESKDFTPVDAEKFIDKRNIKWIPRMKEMMKDNRVFFAFGAGHLGGETGVISLLRKEGYTVTAVK